LKTYNIYIEKYVECTKYNVINSILLLKTCKELYTAYSDQIIFCSYNNIVEKNKLCKLYKKLQAYSVSTRHSENTKSKVTLNCVESTYLQINMKQS